LYAKEVEATAYSGYATRLDGTVPLYRPIDITKQAITDSQYQWAGLSSLIQPH